MDNYCSCANCGLRRTIHTVERVIIAHKCIRNDDFITDFSRTCPHWEEMRAQQVEKKED